MHQPLRPSPPIARDRPDREEATRAARRVTWLGVVANGLLSITKVVAGILSGSSALIADAAHSVSDLVTDGVVLVSIKMASAPADAEHPYGHGRFETVGTIVLAVMLLGTAAGLVWEAISELGRESIPGAIALWAAGLSIVVNEGLYQVTVRVGRRYNSQLIIANAWHSRTDAISSVAALAGIAGARLGFPILDPVAAIIIAALIAKVAVGLLIAAAREITDTALEREMVAEIERDLPGLPGVVSIHELRARRMGPSVLIDLHVQVDGGTTVSDGHQVAERVRRHLLERWPNVNDVLVHVDPEPDDPNEIFVARPREELEPEVRREASGVEGVRTVTHVAIHFLERRVGVNVNIEVDAELRVTEASAIGRLVRTAVQRVDGVDHADVHLELDDAAHRELPPELSGLRPSQERIAAEEASGDHAG